MVNMFLFAREDLDEEGLWHVRDKEHSVHLLKQLKVTVGSTVKVGLVGGGVGKAEVVAIVKEGKGNDVVLRPNVEELSVPPPPPSGIGIILANPRPKMYNRIMQTLATMRVDYCALVSSHRVEKAFFQSSTISAENTRRNLAQGLEQGVHTVLPTVQSFPGSFEKFLDKELDAFLTTCNGDVPVRRFVADPWGDFDLATTMCRLGAPQDGSPPGRVVLAIGPEGGWIEEEIGMMKRAGFHAFHIDKPILRVETAITAVLGQIYLIKNCAASLKWEKVEETDGDAPPAKKFKKAIADGDSTAKGKEAEAEGA